jgi:hypothetical protein
MAGFKPHELIPRARVVSGVNGDGLRTTVLPARSAGANFHAASATARRRRIRRPSRSTNALGRFDSPIANRSGLTCPSAATNGVGLVSRTAPEVYTASPTCRSSRAPSARPTTARDAPAPRVSRLGAHEKPRATQVPARCGRDLQKSATASTTEQPATTWPDAEPRAERPRKSCASSSATSPVRSSGYSPPRTQPRHQQPDWHIPEHPRRRDAAHRGGRPWPTHTCPTMAAEAPESTAAIGRRAVSGCLRRNVGLPVRRLSNHLVVRSCHLEPPPFGVTPHLPEGRVIALAATSSMTYHPTLDIRLPRRSLSRPQITT